jgi:polyhydroxybutyrate depolymerase
MKMILNVVAAFCSMVLICCDKAVPDPPEYRYSESIVVDGIQRTFIVKLPKNYYDNANDRPMLIGLHGTGGNAAQFEESYGFNLKADAEGFVAVYPDGVQKDDGIGLLKIRTWNAGSCCDYAMYNNVNDVKFISILIDSISTRFHINRRKVYVTGMSNGGMMAYRIASELTDKIAAIGVVSGTMVATKDVTRQGKTPILHIHAVPDTKVPYAGGTGIGGYDFPPVMDGINYWVNRNDCNPGPVTEQYPGYQFQTWKNSEGNPVIQLYLTNDGGHAWPSSAVQGRRGDTPSTVINATNLIWEFMNRFSL